MPLLGIGNAVDFSDSVTFKRIESVGSFLDHTLNDVAVHYMIYFHYQRATWLKITQRSVSSIKNTTISKRFS